MPVSYGESRTFDEFLWAGRRGRFISHLLTSIQQIRTDMQEVICTRRKRDVRLLGKGQLLSENCPSNIYGDLESILSLFLWMYRCDRILWYGEGLHQLSYVRGESKFSDHRPVYGVFWAEVESQTRMKKIMGHSSSKVQVEELLPYSHGYTELNFF